MSGSDGRTVAYDQGAYSLKSVMLDDLHVKTEAFTFPHPKKVNVNFTVAEPDDLALLRLTSVKVELLDNDDDVVATLESTFKVQFASPLEGPIEEALAHELNMVATRISYPYHRQLISDLVTRMGLRPTFLPAVPDDLWDASEGQVGDDGVVEEAVV